MGIYGAVCWYIFVLCIVIFDIIPCTVDPSSGSPDSSLPKHARFSFRNGEVRKLDPVVKSSSLLVTGQTQEESDANTRRMKALRVAGTAPRKAIKHGAAGAVSWLDLWHTTVDNERAQ